MLSLQLLQKLNHLGPPLARYNLCYVMLTDKPLPSRLVAASSSPGHLTAILPSIAQAQRIQSSISKTIPRLVFLAKMAAFPIGRLIASLSCWMVHTHYGSSPLRVSASNK